jgi:hypothetical protein
LIEQYFSRLSSATVIVLTLGLNEVWYDNQSSRHLNCAPSFFATRRNPDRFTLHITDCFENIEQLEAIRSHILRINAQAKLIVTVSPVPLSETFSGRDIVVANTYSKSTLRVAAEVFSARHDNVDYFPSYDMIAISPRDLAYGVDCLHVSDRVVGRVMREFLRLYMDLDVEPQDFTELGYLAANPDVEEAVRLAIFASGFEHWTKYGKSEGRAIAPVDGPTELMIAAGVVNY